MGARWWCGGDWGSWSPTTSPDGARPVCMTGSRRCRWLNAGVRSLEEVLAWADVGVEDPSEARPLGVADDPRDLAVATWDGMVYSPWAKNRAPARIVTTPPWCAAPSAVTTELYHYAFGRPSTLEAATDVIEIDFDTTGWEVSRRYRPVPNGRRASMVGRRW